jgi:hypothetical protein
MLQVALLRRRGNILRSEAQTMAAAMEAKRSGRAAALQNHNGHRTNPQDPKNQTLSGQ